MTHVRQRLFGYAALRWFGYVLVFVAADIGSSLAMLMALEAHDVMQSWVGGFLSLGGGLLAWAAFHFVRRIYPLLSAAVIGLGSGIAGVGGLVLWAQFLAVLAPGIKAIR